MTSPILDGAAAVYRSGVVKTITGWFGGVVDAAGNPVVVGALLGETCTTRREALAAAAKWAARYLPFL